MENEGLEVMLVASLGGSPQPLVKSLCGHQPTRVLFIASADTAPLVPSILEDAAAGGWRMAEGAWGTLVVPDHQDLDACVERIRTETASLPQWREEKAARRLVVDFTGGTKAMSAALVVVARSWGCEWSYVGGGTRDKEGLGIVQSGTEEIRHLANAESIQWDVLRPQFVSLFDAGDYGAAAQIAMGQQQVIPRESATRRRWTAALSLATAYLRWDLFEYPQAENLFRQLLKKGRPRQAADTPGVGVTDETLEYRAELAMLAGTQAEELLGVLGEHRRLTAALAQASPRLHEGLLRDLLANARRCGSRSRWDDGTARLYRAVEMAAQVRLQEEYRIHTGAVVVADLPEVLRGDARLQGVSGGDGSTKWGLQDAYLALARLQDPVGLRFGHLFPPRTSPLEARNTSLLAHGAMPVSDKDFRSLWSRALELLAVAETDLVEFPRLGDVRAVREPQERQYSQ